jgi:hypothetical protein
MLPFKQSGGRGMRILIVFAVALFCGSCSHPVQHETASGHPEVTVQNVAADKVKAALVNKMLNKGYRITRDTQFELAYDKPVENVMASVLLGSKYDSQPNARVAYSIAQVGKDVRVVADLAVITNPGSAFERRTDLNRGVESPKVQTFLDDMASEVRPTVGNTRPTSSVVRTVSE